VENITTTDWNRNFEVNVLGYALLVKHIVPIMKQQRAGSIVQFGSISGVVAQVPFLPYGAGKAAVIQMTKNLAVDLGPYNIRCNSISPGLVGTSFEIFR
jgi:NAD(P)-dependent dehydrogenase (short-subunit alcohol dehydrogenase family)